MRLVNDLLEHFEYFQQRDDARGHPGFTPTQKSTAALRQLAYGAGSDMLDEYLQMAKKTGRDSLNHFCKEHFKYGYYLVDGIYSEWGTLVQAYASPLSDKRKYFTKRQESARKDIERAFGVLKKKWAILANPIKFWIREKITEVVYTCVILHNMILEDEGHAICQNYQGDIPRQESTITNEQRLDNLNIIKCREIHDNLRHELVEHLWDNRPDNLVLD
ncbi:uncharacterized protein LOC143548678 [Bidens hawaiensis]|uniref:uncharacterized protein LOC143548678 n=1 Tax=Bidens hawaiensis TaxID=980011 RepID=UPI00404982F8